MNILQKFGLTALLLAGAVDAADTRSGLSFDKNVAPVLEKYCFDCHGDGTDKGDLTLDHHKSAKERLSDHKSWLAVWENLRAQMMPPAKKDQPSTAERELVMRWIEREVFKVDPDHPDPGRVTIRRLNRVEYQNTVNDLLGVRIETDEKFPPDDTGYGFDTIGDVLSISPLLLEKYLKTAENIVTKAVPVTGPRIPTVEVPGDRFRSGKATAHWAAFENPALYEHRQALRHSGRYRIKVELRVSGSMEASSHSATLALRANGRELAREALGWDNRKSIYVSGEADLKAGDNTFGLQLLKGDRPEDGEHPLRLTVRTVYLQGPLNGEHRQYPRGYQFIFTDGPPPDDVTGREVYARKILRRLADYAFRRPIDEPTLDRLVKLAIKHDQEEGVMFEQGIGRAVTAILASPRFLFRAEIQPEPNDPGKVVNLDEFSLASRLSYFLGSTLPDRELMELATKGELRANLGKQIDRLIDHPNSQRFVDNFVGQWLQTRDVEAINIDPRRILKIRDSRQANRVFNSRVRQAMRQETEMMFAHILQDNRSVLELLTADYTFLNSTLAKFYGIDGINDDKMRKVPIPAGKVRGGILTHGSVLLVTSNPTRTSPVKRGLFVLENILGTPAPPAPPDVPDLDEVVRSSRGRLSMRKAMARHREQPLCASCHERFDPIGLAMENFNALGIWRDQQDGEPIDASGQLATGEKFRNVEDLARLLANDRRADFYRCLTEKLLTYALGRGMEYYDTPTVDRIARELDQADGKMRSLIHLIVESVPFQKRRGDGNRLLSQAR
jgi:hypothetical protein